MRNARRRAGFALADFVAGSVILAGGVGAWAALTRAQIDTAALVERRTRALYAAEEALARTRASPAHAAEVAARSKDGGWIELERFSPRGLVPTSGASPGLVEVRPLVAKTDGAAPAAVEVRAHLEWRGDAGTDRLDLETVVVNVASAPKKEEPKKEEPKKEEPKKEEKKPEEPKKEEKRDPPKKRFH